MISKFELTVRLKMCLIICQFNLVFVLVIKMQYILLAIV